jgi:hypothetical protein
MKSILKCVLLSAIIALTADARDHRRKHSGRKYDKNGKRIDHDTQYNPSRPEDP